MTSYGAIVIGAGLNGLAAALRLARAGRRVAVLDARESVGGLASPDEIHPGYVAPGILHDDGRVDPSMLARLGLGGNALALRRSPATWVAYPSGPGIRVGRDVAASVEAIGRVAPRDADAWAAYRAWLDRVAPLFRRIFSAPPPPLAPEGLGDWWRLAGDGLALARLGRADATELARVAPMCVADFLGERFETPGLVEGLALPAVAGTWAGPWSAGTTTNLLLAETAPGSWVAGGPPALVAALAAAAEARGAEIRTGTRVARLNVEGGAVAGVELESGETLAAPLVVSTADPKQSLLALLPPGTLPLRVEEEVRRIRSRGTAAKLHLALSGPFELAGQDGETVEAARIGGGHVDELERAFDAIKYRRMSSHPALEVRVPSVADPSLAPAGHHVVTVLASFAPRDIDGGWTAIRRHALSEAILDRLEASAPGTRSKIVALQLLTPADLERGWSLSGGQLDHVEPALDQLFVLRPSASLARYATPVAGYFLGGSGCHGGGGLSITAGVLAAETALATRAR
ncbi:MAG: NAD(P)/FAD-dependent oxidoreductase [Holophagales bacterium]|nr:NAD(P)/FAD-dependent oxidoreductase [Holophagales bacterium]